MLDEWNKPPLKIHIKLIINLIPINEDNLGMVQVLSLNCPFQFMTIFSVCRTKHKFQGDITNMSGDHHSFYSLCFITKQVNNF